MESNRGREPDLMHGPVRIDETGARAPLTLVVASTSVDAAGLESALRALGREDVHVLPVSALEHALQPLRDGAAGVVLDLGGDGAPADALRRIRDLDPHAALVAVAPEGRNGPPGSVPGLDAFELVRRDDPPHAIARAVCATLECRELKRRVARALRELNDWQERFHNIIQRTADGIVIVGGDRRIRFVNPAAEALFGRPAIELLGQDFGFPLVVDDTTEIDIVRPGAEPIVAELRTTHTSWLEEPAQLVSLRDITDRKKAEQRARRLVIEQSAREQAERADRRSRFLAEASAILDASLDLDATLDRLARLLVPGLADWCVIDLVEAGELRRAAGVHGNSDRQGLLEELKRRFPPRPDSPHPASHPLARSRPLLLRELDRRVIRELAGDDEHARLLHELGTRSVIAVPIRSREQPLGALTLVRGEHEFDAADLALAEEVGARASRAIDNARLYQAALDASRAKSDFLAVVSHELRTPLNAILGYSELLLGDMGEDFDRQRALRRIDASARHLLQIIDEILTHAGLENGRGEPQLQPCRLRELVDDVVAVAEPLVAEKGLDFRLRVSSPEAELHSDRHKIRQIMLNLISNAVKFTDEGHIELQAELDGDALVLVVADTGIGIAAAHLERIFDPFWQAEQPLTRVSGGTGLGLSICRRLADMLGGALHVTSKVGAGSTFTLRLPLRLPGRDQGADVV
jgi:signal transduction histidine kinase/PAS domain-containing protein